jgi:RNA polymerase sigma-70 factor (sigma-E family)
MLSANVKRQVVVDKPGIGELYLQHADSAVRFAYLLTGDLTVAEDLVQDAFVRLTGRLVHLRDPEAFDAYLRRTILNLSHSHFRHVRVERAYLERERTTAGGTASTAPDHSLEDRDELWSKLAVLSARQRAAIVLRFYEDLSEAEVAQVLKCAPGTVKSLVSRGLEKLRTEMRGEDL